VDRPLGELSTTQRVTPKNGMKKLDALVTYTYQLTVPAKQF
jgi:hypothetical protein